MIKGDDKTVSGVPGRYSPDHFSMQGDEFTYTHKGKSVPCRLECTVRIIDSEVDTATGGLIVKDCELISASIVRDEEPVILGNLEDAEYGS